jgi:hypothetical protein
VVVAGWRAAAAKADRTFRRFLRQLALAASLRPDESERSRHVAIVVDRDHLPRDGLCRIRSEEDRERRNVFWIDHRLDRLHGHGLGCNLLHGPAAQLRPPLKNANDTISMANVLVSPITPHLVAA